MTQQKTFILLPGWSYKLEECCFCVKPNKSGLSDGVKSPWTPDKMFDLRPFLEILGRVIVKLDCVSGFWACCLRPLSNILLTSYGSYGFPRCALNGCFFAAWGTNFHQGNEPSYPHLKRF